MDFIGQRVLEAAHAQCGRLKEKQKNSKNSSELKIGILLIVYNICELGFTNNNSKPVEPFTPGVGFAQKCIPQLAVILTQVLHVCAHILNML